MKYHKPRGSFREAMTRRLAQRVVLAAAEAWDAALTKHEADAAVHFAFEPGDPPKEIEDASRANTSTLLEAEDALKAAVRALREVLASQAVTRPRQTRNR